MGFEKKKKLQDVDQLMFSSAKWENHNAYLI